jgi:hypothetical protein
MSKNNKNENDEELDKNDRLNTMFSNCCSAFIIYVNNIMLCSGCGEVKHTIEDDEEITIGVEYNVVGDSETSKNVNSDIIKNQYRKAKRCAHDITYTLVNKKCPECKCCLCRFGRDANENKMFICTNCRNVFNE